MSSRATTLALLLMLGPACAFTGAAETSLPVQLVGTIVTDGRAPLALVHDRRANREGVYRVGEAVAGALITEITADRVVFTVNGERVELRLGVASAGGAGAPGRVVAAPPAPAPPPEPQVPGVSRRELQRLSRAPEVVLQVADTERGARVVDVLPHGLLDVLGIRKGDIIRDVNGRVPTPDRSLAQIIAEAAAADPMLRVFFERKSTQDAIYFRLSP